MGDVGSFLAKLATQEIVERCSDGRNCRELSDLRPLGCDRCFEDIGGELELERQRQVARENETGICEAGVLTGEERTSPGRSPRRARRGRSSKRRRLEPEACPFRSEVDGRRNLLDPAHDSKFRVIEGGRRLDHGPPRRRSRRTRLGIRSNGPTCHRSLILNAYAKRRGRVGGNDAHSISDSLATSRRGVRDRSAVRHGPVRSARSSVNGSIESASVLADGPVLVAQCNSH